MLSKKMTRTKKSQFAHSMAVINPDDLPEQFLKNISHSILDRLKTDSSLKERFEKETGKNFYK